ncbi:MAG: deoxyguanosinetriphosphate triphosphohydrolase [Dehalococcoidales bacterium]|nr:deoxyguanosinetriphosphate triphosphohydrolase [Dehalococcoidales bacterium]
MIGQLNIRQLAEDKEDSLSLYAAKSKQSRGRLRNEEPCPIRTAFQRDRDRIVYSNAFRRLKHKTQVFIDPRGDHYVTRLTHTLEVSQIARTIARALNLNEDLTEAIALGHDLGHTPFGHVGEDVLDELYPPGFRHNEQSLRIVDLLEKDGRGLNLTWEVRDGIVKHSKSRSKILKDWEPVGTLEGEVVRIADVVTYINHDIDDAARAGIISEADLPLSAVSVLGNSHRERINNMVTDVLVRSWSLRTGDTDSPEITMRPDVLAAANTLRDFLFDRIYNMNAAEEETARAREIIRHLYSHFNEREDELPPEYHPRLHRGDDTERRVVDYIAGMTDQYAFRLAEELRR